MQPQLLVDSCVNSGFELKLCESNKNGRIKFQGKFQEADAVNKNKRSYPFRVLDENVKLLKETMENRGLFGELDHPESSVVHLENASHVVTNLWWEGKVLMGEGEVLTTPGGRILQALINDGVRIGISSRGVGQGTTDESGILQISEGYKLITFDAVADPSTFAAFQERVVDKSKVRSESLQNTFSQSSKTHLSSKILKEGIDTVSKEALVVCLGQIIQNRANQR